MARSRRCSETGTAVPSVCANRLTRSSSSSQRISTTSASSRRVAGSRAELLVLPAQLHDGGLARGVANRVGRQPLQAAVYAAQVTGEMLQSFDAGGGHEAGVQQAVVLPPHVGDRGRKRAAARGGQCGVHVLSHRQNRYYIGDHRLHHRGQIAADRLGQGPEPGRVPGRAAVRGQDRVEAGRCAVLEQLARGGVRRGRQGQLRRVRQPSQDGLGRWRAGDQQQSSSARPHGHRGGGGIGQHSQRHRPAVVDQRRETLHDRAGAHLVVPGAG